MADENYSEDSKREMTETYREYEVKKARTVMVVETIENRGTGTEEDPVREVARYWDLEGNFIGEVNLL